MAALGGGPVGDDAAQRQRGAPVDAAPSRLSRVLVAAAVLGILAYMTYTAFGFGVEARRAPLVVGVPGTVLAAFLLLREIRGTEGSAAAEESLTSAPGSAPDLGDTDDLGSSSVSEADVASGADVARPTPAATTEQLPTWGAVLWIAGLAAMFLASGFFWTTLLFPPIFMWFYGRERWTTIAVTTVAVFAVTYLFFIVALDIQVYRGFLGLPGVDQLFF